VTIQTVKLQVNASSMEEASDLIWPLVKGHAFVKSISRSQLYPDKVSAAELELRQVALHAAVSNAVAIGGLMGDALTHEAQHILDWLAKSP
jgi:hypothetical protein